jgi:hypothetical protein
MNVQAKLEVKVAGERWTPVPTLAGCGPRDPCYVIRVDDDGAATLVFGDGTTGRRPPTGAQVEATYRRSGSETRNARTGPSRDPSMALLDAWAQIADLLSLYQNRIASEGYLETDTERRSIAALGELRQMIRGRHGGFRVCVCLTPVNRGGDHVIE